MVSENVVLFVFYKIFNIGAAEINEQNYVF